MPVAPTSYVPQLAPARRAVWRRQAVTVWALAGLAGLGVALLIVAAPLAQAGGYDAVARGIYRSFSLLCHQQAARSFHWHAYPFAVCARCTGLYWGLAAGLLAYPLVRSWYSLETPARGWLFLALMPVGIDFLLGYTGLWANTHWSRALTGGLLGIVIAFYLVPGLLDLHFHWRTYLASPPAVEKPLATVTEADSIAAAPSDYSTPTRRLNISG
jgi:uncharacterized membrane protein